MGAPSSRRKEGAPRDAKRRAAAPAAGKRAGRMPRAPSRILVIDIGGTSVKILATGHTEPRKVPSHEKLTPTQMIESVMEVAAEWDYDAVSIGYPGLVGAQGPRSEPGNLGAGWVGFNFAAAFDRPVRIINDAAMQALGSYDGGRMLFLGLGTGLGSVLIAEHVVVPMELGELPWKGGRPIGVELGRDRLDEIGKREWRKRVARVVAILSAAFTADHVVLGGGNAKLIKKVPPGVRIGHNLAAFRGGFRLWNLPDVQTLSAEGESAAQPATGEWRVI